MGSCCTAITWFAIGPRTKVQGKVAPSSGEAELMSANMGPSTLAGAVQLHQELTGFEIRSYHLMHRVDAVARRGVLLRRGAGAVKHLEVRELWGQEVIRRLGILVEKVPRPAKVFDVMASINKPTGFHQHLNLDFEFAVMDLQEVNASVLLPCSQ